MVLSWLHAWSPMLGMQVRKGKEVVRKVSQIKELHFASMIAVDSWGFS